MMASNELTQDEAAGPLSKMMTSKGLTRREAAEFLSKELGLPVAAATLAKAVTVGGGPPYRKFGRRVIYEPDALIEWATARLSGPLCSSSEVQKGNG